MASFVLFWQVLTPSAFKGFSNSLIAASLSVSNFYYLTSIDYFSPAAAETPLLHTWSLAVEEQFYLFYPILFLFSRVQKHRLIIVLSLGFASFILCLVGVEYSQSTAYYLLPTRAWELLAGALIVLLARDRKLKRNNPLALFGIFLIVYSIVFFNEGVLYPSVYTIIPVLGAALFIAYASTTGVLGWLLANKYTVNLGKISFSAYLWHQIIFVYARLAGHDTSALGMKAFLIGIVLVLAALTYFIVERPLRYAKVNIKTVVYATVLTGGVCVSLGVWGAVGKGLPFRMSDEYLRFDNELTFNRVCLTTLESDELTYVEKDCVFGEKNADLKIGILGDSVAASLAPAVIEIFEDHPAQVIQATFTSCTPLRDTYLVEEINYTWRCVKAYENAVELFRSEGVRAVVIAGVWEKYLGDFKHKVAGDLIVDHVSRNSVLRQQFINTIHHLKGQGFEVFLIGPMAFVDNNSLIHDTRQMILQGQMDLDAFISLSEFDQGIAKSAKVFAPDNLGVWIVEPKDVFCTDRCYLGRNGKMYLADRTHYTAEGARLIASHLREKLIKAGILPPD